MSGRATRPSPALARSAALCAFGCALLLAAGQAHAVPAVFQGDPVDGLGRAHPMLPGVPLVLPGPDEDWQTGDDLIDVTKLGDVDLVVRAGGTYVPGSGIIPPPASGLGSAPTIVAGGTTLQASGGEVAFQLVVSDGAPAPAAGNPLTSGDLDGRGALVIAYADLDGDDVLGPTGSDAAGGADDALELQETLTPVGRRLGVVGSGLVAGTMAIATGLPASAGGLGTLLVGGVVTGQSSPLFLDGPWIATLLPCMWPVDATRVVGTGPGAPDPLGLVDIELEREDFFCPAPGHPLLGTPYAIPLDGSSVTNDVVRVVSGPAVAPGIAVPVSASGFDPAPLRRLTPLVGSGGARAIAEPVRSLTIADDGPGGTQGELVVFPADALGNQADVPAAGSTLALAASSSLHIVSPDTDADPHAETIAFPTTGHVSVVVDDAGGAGDGGAAGTIVASLDGTAGAAVRVAFDGAATLDPLATGKAHLRHGPREGADRAHLTASFVASPALDVARRDLTVTIRANADVIVARTIPAGRLTANGAGTAWRYRDPTGVNAGRIAALVLRRSPATGAYALRLAAKSLDLRRVDPDERRISVEVAVGVRRFADDLDCSANASATTTTCVR